MRRSQLATRVPRILTEVSAIVSCRVVSCRVGERLIHWPGVWCCLSNLILFPPLQLQPLMIHLDTFVNWFHELISRIFSAARRIGATILPAINISISSFYIFVKKLTNFTSIRILRVYQHRVTYRRVTTQNNSTLCEKNIKTYIV